MPGKYVRHSVIALLVLWILWALQPILAARMLIAWKPEIVGQWGDSFGALNALFSAFAFIAVLLTLTLQREDLAKQQEQITANEKDQQRQRFERTFYELLRLLKEAREAVEYKYTQDFVRAISSDDTRGVVSGATAFKKAHFEIIHWSSHAHKNEHFLSSDELTDIYMRYVHERFESSFSPFYRLLYALLSRISNEECISLTEKQFYGNIVRNHLASHELALCCYHGLAPASRKFKDLLVEFRLLKYIPVRHGRNIFMRHYDSSAFMGRDASAS